MDYVKAFLIGGLICALVQILMEKTKDLETRCGRVSRRPLEKTGSWGSLREDLRPVPPESAELWCLDIWLPLCLNLR